MTQWSITHCCCLTIPATWFHYLEEVTSFENCMFIGLRSNPSQGSFSCWTKKIRSASSSVSGACVKICILCDLSGFTQVRQFPHTYAGSNSITRNYRWSGRMAEESNGVGGVDEHVRWNRFQGKKGTADAGSKLNHWNWGMSNDRGTTVSIFIISNALTNSNTKCWNSSAGQAASVE